MTHKDRLNRLEAQQSPTRQADYQVKRGGRLVAYYDGQPVEISTPLPGVKMYINFDPADWEKMTDDT